MKTSYLYEEVVDPRPWYAPNQQLPGLSSVWGLATIAPIHLGMDRLVVQQKALVASGSAHTVILADVHAVLGGRLPSEEAGTRLAYYQAWLELACGLKAHYVHGSRLQETPPYSHMLYALSASTSLRQLKAGLPGNLTGKPLSAFDHLQLLMQCLDPVALGADIVFADQGQEKVYSTVGPDQLAAAVAAGTGRAPEAEQQPKVPDHYVYSVLSSDITGRPLHSSSRETRISLHDDDATVRAKVARMLAPPPGQPLPTGRRNALEEHLRWSVFPWLGEEPFLVEVRAGAARAFHTMAEFESAYAVGDLHPADVKDALFQALRRRLHEARERMPAPLLGWVRSGAAR